MYRPVTRGCAASGRALAVDASGDDLDVFRLGSLLALRDVELDFLSFLQVAVAAAGDRAEVHEHVRASLHCNEAVALIAVEPFHCALRHRDLLCCGCGPAMPAGVRVPAIPLASLSCKARGRKPCGGPGWQAARTHPARFGCEGGPAR